MENILHVIDLEHIRQILNGSPRTNQHRFRKNMVHHPYLVAHGNDLTVTSYKLSYKPCGILISVGVRNNKTFGPNYSATPNCLEESE